MNIPTVINKFIKIILFILIILLSISLTIGVFDRIYMIISDLRKPPFALLNVKDIKEIFGLFLLLLVGIELLEIIKVYFEKNVIMIEVVIFAALIAITRKLLILDINNVAGDVLIGLGVVIIALSGGYFLLKKESLNKKTLPEKEI